MNKKVSVIFINLYRVSNFPVFLNSVPLTKGDNICFRVGSFDV